MCPSFEGKEEQVKKKKKGIKGDRYVSAYIYIYLHICMCQERCQKVNVFGAVE